MRNADPRGEHKVLITGPGGSDLPNIYNVGPAGNLGQFLDMTKMGSHNDVRPHLRGVEELPEVARRSDVVDGREIVLLGR